MNKQTAVEWLHEKLPLLFEHDDNNFYKDLFTQAKAIECIQKNVMFDCGRQYQLTGEGSFKQVHIELYSSEPVCYNAGIQGNSKGEGLVGFEG